ncbi:MAG: DUF4962 domain-containing protein, partial [Armatimonadota bacterium]
VIAAIAVALALQMSVSAGVIIDDSAKVRPDPRQEHARLVKFRPGDGQTVGLNPPRMSWPYTPDFQMQSSPHNFTLQISDSEDFSDPVVEIADTPYNFSNFLPALSGSDTWYWRVAYSPGTDEEQWSDVRSFAIAPDAVTWDRSGISEQLDGLTDHPRILMTDENRDIVLAQDEHDWFSAELRDRIIAAADAAIEADWYVNFPDDDSQDLNYLNMGRSLVEVMLAHLMTDDEKYAGYRERFVEMATWEKGGYASPEGCNKSGQKWPTHLTEFLGVFYDWCYDDLTPQQRETVRNSLQWRLEWTMNNFAWKRNDGVLVHRGSIAVWGSSHPYENTMVSLAGALAICDESEIARQFAEMAIHHIIGITNSYGEDEGWNEGPGYGNGKMKWLTDAVSYLHGTLPELEINKNEVLSRYCDFFARITPVGAKHCSFGNRGRNPRDWCSSRVTNFRRVAMLRDDPQAMGNWYNTREWLKQEYDSEVIPFSPWIDYCLSAYVDEPEPAVEDDPVKLFDLEGWVTASSAPPSDLEAQREAVSMTFHCRPRGGYGHSFRNENAFDIHAFGKTVAVGGGNTSNRSWFANHTMSHNTCLVNGQEQLAAKQHGNSPYGRVIAFDRGDNYVYWAGDATAAYGPDTDMGKFVRHVLFVDNAYFVVFDELQMADDVDPGTFQWLYHMIPEVPLEFDEDSFRISYAMDEVNVAVQHCAHVDDLTYKNLPGGEGMVNPITGEDVSRSDKWAKGAKNLPDAQAANHIWISHETPRSQMNFLTVIVPYQESADAPVVEPVSDTAVGVTFGGTERLLSFEPDENADVSVDCAAISE